MLENSRVPKPREFWISPAYFRTSTVLQILQIMNLTISRAFLCAKQEGEESEQIKNPAKIAHKLRELF